MEQNCSQKRSVVVRFKRFSGKSFSAFHSMGRIVNIGVLAGITLSTVALHDAEAQQRKPNKVQESNDETELSEVMVTASKVATPINQVARQVTVITKREIASAPIRSLQDLLVYSAGVDVQQRGGHGVQADISIRGGSFDQNAILLNGVNLSNPETGHLSYDIPINLSDIERIEIIHGASGLIYGSAAFSGGINIITKKEVHERLYAQIIYGAHNTYSAEGRIALRTHERSTHSLSLGYKASDGYTDNTDYKQFNALAQSNLHLDDLNKVQVQIGYNRKAYGANAFYAAAYAGQYDETSNFLASARAELGTKNFRIIPIIYWNNTHDHYILIRNNPKAYENFHNTTNYGGNLILNYISKWGTTSLGTELRREGIMSNALGGEVILNPTTHYKRMGSRTNASLSLEHSLNLGETFSASVGALLNHNTQRQGVYELLPSINATYRPSRAWSISASWSRGVRIPTYIDLYYVGRVQQADPNLSAEHSQSLELSLKYRTSAFDAYATAFGLQGTNIIDWAKTNPSDAKYRSMNHGSLNTYGVEAGMRLRLAPFLSFLGTGAQLKLDYTYMTQKHDSKGLISMYAMRYLKHKLTGRLDVEPMKQLTTSLMMRYQERMGQYESGKSPSGVVLYSPYPAFVTFDARVAYTLTKQCELSMMFNNITNTRYFDFSAVHQPGFWASFGLTYRLR